MYVSEQILYIYFQITDEKTVSAYGQYLESRLDSAKRQEVTSLLGRAKCEKSCLDARFFLSKL